MEKGWFCVQYFDFHGGDTGSTKCPSYDEAVKMIMSKPKQSDIAHSHIEGTLYSKAVDRGSVLTIKKWKPGQKLLGKVPSMFVYGINTGIHHNSRTLVYLENVKASGGDG